MGINNITGIEVITEERYAFDPTYFSNGRVFMAQKFNGDGTLYWRGMAIIVMNSDRGKNLHFNFYRKVADNAVCSDPKEIIINGDVVADGTWRFTPVNISDSLKKAETEVQSGDPSSDDTIKELQDKLLKYDYMLDELEPAKRRAEVAEQDRERYLKRLSDTQGKRGEFLGKVYEALGIEKMPPFWDEAEEKALETIRAIMAKEG